MLLFSFLCWNFCAVLSHNSIRLCFLWIAFPTQFWNLSSHVTVILNRILFRSVLSLNYSGGSRQNWEIIQKMSKTYTKFNNAHNPSLTKMLQVSLSLRVVLFQVCSFLGLDCIGFFRSVFNTQSNFVQICFVTKYIQKVSF